MPHRSTPHYPTRRAFLAYDHHYQQQPHQQWLQQLLQGRPVVFQASDLFSLQQAARSGLGAAVLPTFVADGDPDLVPLPTANAAPTRELWLVTYPDLARTTAVRAVMNFWSKRSAKRAHYRHKASE